MSVLSAAVQLSWINIIIDTFAAIASATDPASHSLLDSKPDKLSAPLFLVNMYVQADRYPIHVLNHGHSYLSFPRT